MFYIYPRTFLGVQAKLVRKTQDGISWLSWRKQTLMHWHVAWQTVDCKKTNFSGMFMEISGNVNFFGPLRNCLSSYHLDQIWRLPPSSDRIIWPPKRFVQFTLVSVGRIQKFSQKIWFFPAAFFNKGCVGMCCQNLTSASLSPLTSIDTFSYVAFLVPIDIWVCDPFSGG